MRHIHIFACLILIFTLFACKKSTDGPAVTKPLDLPAGSDAVITASNQFAFKFFNATLQNDPEPTNKLISPLSIYTALSMVYNGAANATRDSIAKALQLQGISIDDLNALNKALIDQMPAEDSKVTFNIANSIWYKQGGPQPLPAFLNTIQDNYDAAAKALDFSNASSVNTINSWVAAKTKNKIPKIISSIQSDELMFLVNAIYFNGSWMHAFNSANTRDNGFDRISGGPVSVPFMNEEMNLRVDFASTFTLVELPYGGGKSYDMYLMLPNDRDKHIEDFAATFNKDSLAGAISNLDSQFISISIPKWEYAYSIDDMKPALTQMGMSIAFGSADFTNMYPPSPGRWYISRALHKTYIKVSEQGTEAAAATVISVGLTSAPLIRSVVFNHPFLYMLREKQSGVILFIGIVNDPSK